MVLPGARVMDDEPAGEPDDGEDDTEATNVTLGKKELQKIQQDIAGTMRPTWHASPLSNFGNPSHGKLKADQWRSCIEFDLPVSLMQLWSTEGPGDDGTLYEKRKGILKSMMLLAMAIH